MMSKEAHYLFVAEYGWLPIRIDGGEWFTLDGIKIEKKPGGMRCSLPADLPAAMSDVAPLSMRDRVIAFEQELLKLEQIKLPLKHYFAPGLYAREITIPAGFALTGRIHKYWQLNILSEGEISVLTENGIVRVKNSFTVVSPPGTKRAAYAHTDCKWTTILATDETDPDKIEQLFTVATEQEYLDFVAEQQIGEMKCLSN